MGLFKPLMRRLHPRYVTLESLGDYAEDPGMTFEGSPDDSSE